MKKAFPSNINGRIFYIDEDAYSLLNSYLASLKATFPGAEGREVVEDIETRISEHFDERLSAARGSEVITIDDVNKVITIMGRPEEIGDDAAMADEDLSPKKAPTPPPYHRSESKKLYRNTRNKVFGGVISGLACYMGWDITVMRILAVVLALFTYFWPCVLIYLIAWMVIPEARTPRQILEMQGEPVNLGSVGQTVIDNAASQPGAISTDSGFGAMANSIAQMIGVFIMGGIGLVAGVAAVATIIIGLVILAGIICYATGAEFGLLDAFDVSLSAPYLEGWGMFCVMFAVALPMVGLAWAGCCVVFKAPSAPTPIIVSGLVLEVLLIIAAAVLLNIGEGISEEVTEYIMMGTPVALLATPMC